MLRLEVFHRFAKLAFSSLTGLIWASAGLGFGSLSVVSVYVLDTSVVSRLACCLRLPVCFLRDLVTPYGRKDGIPVLSTAFLN